jgi:hypothetical protein
VAAGVAAWLLIAPALSQDKGDVRSRTKWEYKVITGESGPKVEETLAKLGEAG